VRDGPEFQEFYEASYGRVVATVAALTGDRHEAEDIAQEAFARAYIKWSALGSYDHPLAWVRKVALRIAVDDRRRRGRVAGLVAKLSVQLSVQRQAPAPDPGDDVTHSPLGAALAALPPREREVMVLHYLADMPVDAIARERGLPAGTVKTRLAAGRQRLEQELAKIPEAMA
jgi:RNA polymerase sigma-70 factor (ECF subfamily)